jgi:hypothetical protein
VGRQGEKLLKLCVGVWGGGQGGGKGGQHSHRIHTSTFSDVVAGGGDKGMKTAFQQVGGWVGGRGGAQPARRG